MSLNDPPASKWRRRLVSIPLYAVAAIVLFATAPLSAVSTLLIDLSAGAWRLPRTRALCFFLLYLVCEIAGLTGAGLIWLFTLGGRLGGAESYVAAHYTLQRWWSSALFWGSIKLFSMRVEVEGRDLIQPGPTLLFVRHSSTADTVLTAALVASPARLKLRYVLKRELLWDPCLDVVGHRLPNAFIDRRAADSVERVAALGESIDADSGVLIYPEGTRYSASKLERSVARLKERGDGELADIATSLTGVLPPRIGGPLSLMESADEAAIIFVDHCGFESASSFGEFWGGGLIGKTVKVRLRRFEPSEIPAEGRALWLFQRWRELDHWLRVALESEPEPVYLTASSNV